MPATKTAAACSDHLREGATVRMRGCTLGPIGHGRVLIADFYGKVVVAWAGGDPSHVRRDSIEVLR